MKKLILILFAAVFAVFGFWFLTTIKKGAARPALCVEITESNHDTFKNQLFMEEEGLQPRERFDFKDRKAKLFLIYHVVYEGVGRETILNNHTTFHSYPAKIPLASFDATSGKVHLALGDSIGRMFGIRLLPVAELLVNETTGGAIKISVGEREFLVSAGEEQTLSKYSKTMTVTQEAFGPVPKGPITEKDIHVETLGYGDIEFSTELKVKNLGSCDLFLP